MRTLVIAPLVLAAACATTQNPPAASAPDPVALKASLEAYVNEANSHIAQGDFAFLKSSACPDSVVMWDFDENGNPVTAKGKPAVEAMLDKYTALAKTPGVQMTTTFGPINCEAFANSGYCLIEMDQTITQNGQTQGPFKARGTLIAKTFKDRWIWTHWHGSMREAPPAPPPADPAISSAEPPAAGPAPSAAAAATLPAAPVVGPKKK